MYCKKCGGKVDSYASNCPFCGEPVAHKSVEATYTASENSAPVTRGVGKWILTYILMSIPVVNFIMLMVWAFGKNPDRTFKSWARSILLLGLITVIACVALVVVFKMTGYMDESTLSSFTSPMK